MSIQTKDYLPLPVALDVGKILDTRAWLEAYTKDQWVDLDTSPGTPAGDLMLTPQAYQVTALQEAIERLFNDLDLDQLRNGNIANPWAARQFLATLGARSGPTSESYATVKLTFSTNTEIRLPNPLVFDTPVGSFQTQPGDESIIIGPTGARGKFVLIPESGGVFSAYIPLSGPAGQELQEGTQILPQAAIPALVSSVVAGGANAGIVEDDIATLARRAQQSFARPGFSTTSNLVSYIRNAYPAIQFARAVTTGEVEMARKSDNLLGIEVPHTDVYIRSMVDLPTFTEHVLLKYNPSNQTWVGGVPAPFGVVSFDELEIFRSNSFRNRRGTLSIHARSKDPGVSPIAASYSMLEAYGIEARDFEPEGLSEADSAGTSVELNGRSYEVILSGSYHGSVFDNVTNRRIELSYHDYAPVTLDGETYWGATFYVRDLHNGGSGKVQFVSKETVDSTPTSLVCDGRQLNHPDRDLSDGYDRFLNGLTLRVVRTDENYGVGGAPVILHDDLVAFRPVVSASARSAYFHVTYKYDPHVALLHERADSLPGTFSDTLLVRAFALSQILELKLYVSISPSVRFDAPGARSAVTRYLNGLLSPQRYQESELYRVLSAYGVAGIDSVSPLVLHRTSPARYYHEDGVMSEAPRNVTRSLTSSLNLPYHTRKNHMWFVTPGAISFETRLNNE